MISHTAIRHINGYFYSKKRAIPTRINHILKLDDPQVLPLASIPNFEKPIFTEGGIQSMDSTGSP